MPGSKRIRVIVDDKAREVVVGPFIVSTPRSLRDDTRIRPISPVAAVIAIVVLGLVLDLVLVRRGLLAMATAAAIIALGAYWLEKSSARVTETTRRIRSMGVRGLMEVIEEACKGGKKEIVRGDVVFEVECK